MPTIGYDPMHILIEIFDVGRLRSPARRHGLLHVRTARELGGYANVSLVGERGNDDDTQSWFPIWETDGACLAYPPGSKRTGIEGGDLGRLTAKAHLLQSRQVRSGLVAPRMTQ